ncbi:hypothetical protein E2C01_019220 [Portunus trituberculatus]|uniref:Uncharacterized protein n=1 Tax=Portunus trituberculatus TaxID=210409 RepID=A0A5B7DYA0_PORTR|nr:hypothetical protein [Portunus trituberculatus]
MTWFLVTGGVHRGKGGTGIRLSQMPHESFSSSLSSSSSPPPLLFPVAHNQPSVPATPEAVESPLHSSHASPFPHHGSLHSRVGIGATPPSYSHILLLLLPTVPHQSRDSGLENL